MSAILNILSQNNKLVLNLIDVVAVIDRHKENQKDDLWSSLRTIIEVNFFLQGILTNR